MYLISKKIVMIFHPSLYFFVLWRKNTKQKGQLLSNQLKFRTRSRSWAALVALALAKPTGSKSFTNSITRGIGMDKICCKSKALKNLKKKIAVAKGWGLRL